jgi:hypothetical protein
MQEIQVLCHNGECMRNLETKACYRTPHWHPSTYVISIWILYRLMIFVHTLCVLITYLYYNTCMDPTLNVSVCTNNTSLLYLNDEVQTYVRSNYSHINLHIIPKWSTNLHVIQLEHSEKLLEHARYCMPPNYPQLWTLNTKSLLLSQPALQKMKPLEVLALSIKLSALQKTNSRLHIHGNQKCLWMFKWLYQSRRGV